jgi:hypothetical protein
VMLFQHCQQAIQALCTGFSQEALWRKHECRVTCFCAHEWVAN